MADTSKSKPVDVLAILAIGSGAAVVLAAMISLGLTLVSVTVLVFQ